MELDFDKYCVVDGSPTTVLPPPPRRSKVSNRKSNGKPKFENDVLRLNEDFTDITFNRYRSASCRDVRSRSVNREGIEVLKRGSVYQSSKELRQLKGADADSGRRKIEVARGSAETFPFGIIDSLCGVDENSLVVEQCMPSVSPLSEHSKDSFFKHQIDLRTRGSMNCSLNPVLDPMIASESVVSRINKGNRPRERDLSVNLNKSLSARLALPNSPTQSESDSSKASSPKSRFGPVRKFFDPFVKSKSQRSPLGCSNESGTESKDEVIGINHNKTVCRSLLNDLSENRYHAECNSRCEMKESQISLLDHSPAHLHAILTAENKNGVPFFEFSVKSPEELYVARTWKIENALNWVYTFHSLRDGRKSNASGWGSKDSHRESMLGQMHISCYICTESKGTRAFEDSMVTEFVLYDIAHSRRSTSSQDNSSNSPDVVKAPLVSDEILSWDNSELNENSAKTKTKDQYMPSRNSNHSEKLHSRPLKAEELHAEHEVAAIIMQVPLEKRESLKVRSGDGTIDKSHSNLLNLSRLEEAKEGFCGSSSCGRMHLVIPAGNHSSPSTESCGPSPLLDRWRLGGGCDCGGWDMACPLNVFGSPNIHIAEGHPPIDEQHPAEFFVQGRKDNLPAFSMRVIEDGKYAVDFHAQLSSLQAFSICVATLHASEASTDVGHERSKNMFQSDSLRVFPEEEIKTLLDDITKEEMYKAHKKMEEAFPSFVLNPPFSPIARV